MVRRKGKLSLMNTRLTTPQQAAVYDSSLDYDLPNTTSTLSSSNYDFDKILRRDQLRSPSVYHSNEIVNPATLTRDGDVATMKQRIVHSPMKSYVKERRSNYYENNLNKTAEIYRTARKIDTTLVFKKGSAADQSIAARVSKSEVPGAQFGQCTTDRPDLSGPISTDMGPGDYDVTAWERGKCGIAPRALKFNRVGGERTDLVSTDGPSATTYFQDSTASPLRPATTGSLKFNTSVRFPDSNPDYLKDTGLLLSSDFDGKRAWRSRGNYGLKDQCNPRAKTAQRSQYGVDFINTDAGKKMTFNTKVQKSTYKYAPCFKSKSRVGLSIPIPASGDIGPDNYEGAYKSTLYSSMPHNKSSSFAAKREINVVQLGDQYSTLKPRFGKVVSGVEHTRNQALNATYGEKELQQGRNTTFGKGRKGKLKKSKFSNKLEYDFTPEVKLSHIAEFSKTKITRIYPRMAKEKYGVGLTGS